MCSVTKVRSLSPRSIQPWFSAADYSEPIKFNFLIWSMGSRVDMSYTGGLHADTVHMTVLDESCVVLAGEMADTCFVAS